MAQEIRITLFDRGQDQNGNPTAHHRVAVDGHTLLRTARRRDIGYGNTRDDWATPFVHKKFGPEYELIEVHGCLPGGSKHFHTEDGSDEMVLVYRLGENC